MKVCLALIVIVLTLTSCGLKPTPVPITGTVPVAEELPVIEIPLTGPVARKRAEVSAMAWYGDVLILVPQYPARTKVEGQDAVFALTKTQILDYLDGRTTEPLEPQAIPFFDADIGEAVRGFEGFEAIAFLEDEVYLTIESSPGSSMMGYLIAGEIAPDLSALRLDAETLTPIEPPTLPGENPIGNLSDETLVLVEDVMVTFYEANGANVNPAPVAHRFDASLNPAPPVDFFNVEYRITDATAADAQGRFWVINSFFPADGKKLDPAPDPLAATHGLGETHRQYPHLERLLELQYSDAGITYTNATPLLLELAEDSRNWEGLVRLDERGFLLVTDTYPETILGFVSP